MKARVESLFQEALAAKHAAAHSDAFLDAVTEAAEAIAAAVAAGGTVYLCGNGGSAADAAHFSEELVARYKRERPGIRAMHFMDPGVLTCWSNDYDFASVFARQAETFCGPDDILVAFSTSGNSENILQVLDMARQKKCKSILFTGKDGGAGKKKADIALIVPSEATERIQEVHITIVHIICELLES